VGSGMPYAVRCMVGMVNAVVLLKSGRYEIVRGRGLLLDER
jgi:hypothetical protein